MGLTTGKCVAACRVAHVICSMVGVIALCLFAVTGVMLVHQQSLELNQPASSRVKKTIPDTVAAAGDPEQVVSHLLATIPHAVALQSFDKEEEGYRVVLAGPRYRHDLLVRPDGRVEGTVDEFGAKDVLVRLHRGDHAGRAWRILMDVAAACLLMACITGVALCLATPKRRMIGLAALVLGTAVYAVGYALLVP